MTIVIRQAGGYAGETKELLRFDTAGAAPAQRQQAERLLHTSDFFNLPSVISGDTIGADLLKYEIAVVDGARHHTVAFDDDETSRTAPIRALKNALLGLA